MISGCKQRCRTALAAIKGSWRRLALEALIVLALVVGVTLWRSAGLASGDAPPLAGRDSNGRLVDLAAAGDRARLVVFWGEWCPICRAEAGNIDAVADDWPVLSVALRSGDAAAVRSYLAEHGLKTAAIADINGAIADSWGVNGVPAHFIVDASGKIRFRSIGYATQAGLRLRLWWADKTPS